MHSVASSPQGHAEGSAGGALCGRSSESSMIVGWTVAGGGAPGQSEGAVVGGVVLLTLGAHAGRVLSSCGDQVVVVVPGVLLLFYLVVRGIGGRATVVGAGGGRSLCCQVALLLVVHEGLLMGPGHRTNHLLLSAVRCTGRG